MNGAGGLVTHGSSEVRSVRRVVTMKIPLKANKTAARVTRAAFRWLIGEGVGLECAPGPGVKTAPLVGSDILPLTEAERFGFLRELTVALFFPKETTRITGYSTRARDVLGTLTRRGRIHIVTAVQRKVTYR